MNAALEKLRDVTQDGKDAKKPLQVRFNQFRKLAIRELQPENTMILNRKEATDLIAYVIETAVEFGASEGTAFALDETGKAKKEAAR